MILASGARGPGFNSRSSPFRFDSLLHLRLLPIFVLKPFLANRLKYHLHVLFWLHLPLDALANAVYDHRVMFVSFSANCHHCFRLCCCVLLSLVLFCCSAFSVVCTIIFFLIFASYSDYDATMFLLFHFHRRFVFIVFALNSNQFPVMCLLSFCSFDAPVVLLFIMCSIFPIIFTFVSCSVLIFVALLACCVHMIFHCVSSCSWFVIVFPIVNKLFCVCVTMMWYFCRSCGPFVSWHFLN